MYTSLFFAYNSISHYISLFMEGKFMRLCDLKQKEVINTCTCSSLGCVCDVDIDCDSGCILFLIVPGPGKIYSFLGRDSEFVIPWKCVCQIGKDIILVEIEEDKCKRKRE